MASVKYEAIYLKAYEDGWQLEKGMRGYFNVYNNERPHQSLDYQTPQKVYDKASVQSNLDCWVKAFQLEAGIFGFKLPVYLFLVLISLLVPVVYLLL